MSHVGPGPTSTGAAVSAGTGTVASTRVASPNSSAVRRSRSAAVTDGVIAVAVFEVVSAVGAAGTVGGPESLAVDGCAGAGDWVGLDPPPQADATTRTVNTAMRLANRLGKSEPAMSPDN